MAIHFQECKIIIWRPFQALGHLKLLSISVSSTVCCREKPLGKGSWKFRVEDMRLMTSGKVCSEFSSFPAAVSCCLRSSDRAELTTATCALQWWSGPEGMSGRAPLLRRAEQGCLLSLFLESLFFPKTQTNESRDSIWETKPVTQSLPLFPGFWETHCSSELI